MLSWSLGGGYYLSLHLADRFLESKPLLLDDRSAEWRPDRFQFVYESGSTAFINRAARRSNSSFLSNTAPLVRRAIAIDEKALGKDHPGVATDYNNLASLLRAQGKLAEAEPLVRRAMEISEKALGKDHPTVATDYNNLASLLRAQGKLAEAEPLYRRAIDIFQTSLGPQHPNTLTVKKNYDGLRKLMDRKSATTSR